MHDIVGARRLMASLGAAALLVGAITVPVFAGTVTAQITAGGLTASVSDLNFPSVVYGNAAHDVTGTMVVTADDSRGAGAGWSAPSRDPCSSIVAAWPAGPTSPRVPSP